MTGIETKLLIVASMSNIFFIVLMSKLSRIEDRLNDGLNDGLKK